MKTEVLSSADLARIRKVDSPTIANVIELFDVRSYVAGYSNSSLKAIYPKLPPAVGYAATATFRASYPADSGGAYGGMPQLIADAMATPEPRIVVFQDLDEPCCAATYGEIMAMTFQKFGFVGLITNGAARDIEQVERLRFPCWASSAIVAHGYCRFLDVQVPVTVGGLHVSPGDLLHADANGIVNIPHEIAPAVAEFCEPYIAAEEIILQYLRASQPTAIGYQNAVSEAKQRMAELRLRARSLCKQGL